MIASIPQGWRVERDVRSDTLIVFDVFEDGGSKWGDGSPRPEITVEVWAADEDFGTDARISWPSTSDKRPTLALALAGALVAAANEVR